MSKVQAAIVSDNAVTVVIDGQTTPITDSHTNYDEIRSLASAGNYADIASLLDLVTPIVEFGDGVVTVEDGSVLYKGHQTHNAVTDRILQMVDEGLSVGPLTAFLENLMLNPSFRAVQELYGFLEVNDLPITDDGCFLAYKMVNRKDDGTLTDIRTGKFDYSVGSPPAEMPRNMVNEDPTMTCEAGLHVCAQGYLGSYSSGECTILVKVNPADVVAVPTDYNNAKMRTCKHETVCEVKSRTRGDVFTSSVFTDADKEKIVAANNAADTTLADDDNVMTFEAAMNHFGSPNRSALLKRLNRGVTAKRVYVGGTEMVQVIDAPDSVTQAEPEADDTVSVAYAMKYFACDRAALRKRCVRGVTAEWAVGKDGEQRVRIIED